MQENASIYGQQTYVSTQLIAPQPRIAVFATLEGRSLSFRLLARLARWMDTRRGGLDLLELSDDQLKDIGLFVSDDSRHVNAHASRRGLRRIMPREECRGMRAFNTPRLSLSPRFHAGKPTPWLSQFR